MEIGAEKVRMQCGERNSGCVAYWHSVFQSWLAECPLQGTLPLHSSTQQHSQRNVIATFPSLGPAGHYLSTCMILLYLGLVICVTSFSVEKLVMHVQMAVPMGL